MGNFQGGDRSGRSSNRGPRGAGGYAGRGGSRFGSRNGGRRGFGDQGEDRQMYQATCAECGNACDVPFRPTGNKPVYCRDCFAQINAGPDGRSDDRDSRSSRRPARRNFDQDHSGNIGGKSAEHFDQQFAQLNDKLDKILRRLTPSYARPAGAAEVEEAVAPEPDTAVED